MPARKLIIEVVSRSGRLRAVAKDDSGRIIGEWWIESRDHRRYLPFKPMPPRVQFIVAKLPQKEQEKLAMFLLTATEGDKIEIELPQQEC